MGRKTLWVLVVGILSITLVGVGLIVVLPIIMLGGWTKIQAEQEACNPSGNASLLIDSALSSSGPSQTKNNASFDSEQLAIARSIIAVVNGRRDIPSANAQQATLVALDAGFTESKLHNLTYGDSDSLGIFQMRPSQGWGTAEQVLDVNYEINKFLDVMLRYPGWQTADIGTVAQGVERSAYPERYAENLSEVEQIHNLVIGTSGTESTSNSAGVCGQDPSQQFIEAAVRAAKDKVGSGYVWGTPQDGAAFVAWAYQQAGIKLPPSLKALANWTGNASANLTATWLPASQIKSGEASLQPGDIPFWSDGQSLATRDNVTRTGLVMGNNSGTGTNFTLATWNIKTGDGYQSRVNLAASLIPKYDLDIVGFQEVERPEIYRAIASAFKGSKYALYPSPPGAVYRNSLAARSVLYNTDRFELLPQKDEIEFRRTNDPQQPAHAPVIRLRDKATGQVIIVANTHSPAFERFAKQRYEAGLAYVQKFQQLSSEGLPMFFTGDFNSGYWMTTSNNVTYQNDRNNLTYCQLTANGLMDDARDVAQGLSGYCPRRPGNGSNTIDHIYVSPGVHVAKTYEIQHVSDHNAVVAKVSVPATAASGQQTPDLGEYVGPNPDKGNKIDVMSISRKDFAGVLRLTMIASFGAFLADTADQGGVWQSPLHTSYVVTDGYGWSDSSVRGYSFHDGVDLGVGTGTPVFAAHSGIVYKAAYGSASGNQIIIDNDGKLGTGFGTKYEHLDAFAPGLTVGGQVSAGQLIGYVGQTGDATGPHLHFSVCSNTRMCTLGSGAKGAATLSPVPYMATKGIKL